MGHDIHLDVDRIAAFNTAYDRLVDALVAGDGTRIIAVIDRIEHDFGSDIADVIIDGLATFGFVTRRPD